MVTPKPEQIPEFKGQQTTAMEQAKSRAAVEAEYEDRQAALPQLVKTIKDLQTTAPKATYNLLGQGVDWIAKEAFGEPTEGAIARTKYTSLVKNEVLPLLRQTFGAAFTAAEGESLLTTFGDPDLTPEQKQAALESLVRSKIRTIQTQERRLGLPESDFSQMLASLGMAPERELAPPPTNTSAGIEVDAEEYQTPPKKGEVRDGYMFMGGNPNDSQNYKKVK